MLLGNNMALSNNQRFVPLAFFVGITIVHNLSHSVHVVDLLKADHKF